MTGKGNIRSKKSADFLIILVVTLVATLSFGLGRLSEKTSQKPEVGFGDMELNTLSASAYANQSQRVIQKNTKPQGNGVVVASKNSTKYHYPWCSGAKRINEENKIYFDTIEQARSQGYEPAGNCAGLK